MLPIPRNSAAAPRMISPSTASITMIGLSTGSKRGAAGWSAVLLVGGMVKARGAAVGSAGRCGAPPNGGIAVFGVGFGVRIGGLMLVGRRVSPPARLVLPKARTAEAITLNATSPPIKIGIKFVGSDVVLPTTWRSML